MMEPLSTRRISVNVAFTFVANFAICTCPRTRVFYCNPQASWQKPHVEKNHTLIRRIIPKSTDLNPYTREQIHLIIRHINSYYREEYGNKTPFELMTSKEQKKLLSALKLTPIPPDEVLLTPSLTKK